MNAICNIEKRRNNLNKGEEINVLAEEWEYKRWDSMHTYENAMQCIFAQTMQNLVVYFRNSVFFFFYFITFFVTCFLKYFKL